MNNENKNNINWFPGHMKKTRDGIKEKLKYIDVVYEVIDSRMPLSSKIKDIDDIIKDKKKIIIATKYDLCDKNETDKILDKYESEGYYIYKCDLLKDKLDNLLKLTNNIMKDEFDSMTRKGLKARKPRVLVLGVPNCGKSTLINKLAGSKKAGTGNTPGFTKNISWIRLNKIDLMDTPGVLWPKLEDQEGAKTLAAFGSIKLEILNAFDISNFILKKMYELYPESLKERYGIESLSEDLIEEYDIIAGRRGALLKGGIADYNKVSLIIIRDLQNSYLGKVTFDRL